MATAEDLAVRKRAAWCGHQYREFAIDLEPSPQLTRLRRNHRTLIAQLKKLGRFKSTLAAAQYAHRNFTR